MHTIQLSSSDTGVAIDDDEVVAFCIPNESVDVVDDKRQDVGDLEIFDKLDFFYKLKPPLNYPSLHTQLRDFLTSSANALKDDPSGQNTQKVLLNVLTHTIQLAAMRAEATDAETQAVMLDAMECSAQFVEANVAVPQFNSKEATGVRTLVFNVYHRLAKVLGRNTPEAVKADTKSFMVKMASRITFDPGRGRKPNNPDQHVETIIKPLLDTDMLEHAFDINVYRFKEMWPLYNVFTLRRSRQARRGDKEAAPLTDAFSS